MRTRMLCVLAFGVFAWASSATAFEPAEVSVHPTLADQFAGFFPPAVLKVTDGIYVARGYNRNNPALIEGSDGLIIVDPGESIPAAQIGREAFNAHLNNIFDRKPVKAIIYTHHHDCHINGASVYAGEGTEIIGHENLVAALFDEWFGHVYPSRAAGGLKMSGALFQDDPGWYAGYTLGGVQILGPSGFLAPTRTVKDELQTTIAGVEVKLISAPGESRDIQIVWLPDKKVLIEIGIIYEAFPALSTMRGSGQRNPLEYLNSLKICRNLGAEYLVALHGPNPIVAGGENVRRFLTDFSDAIQFIHDQTLQYMNKGLAPGEIIDLITLPPHLINRPSLLETYGRVDWDVYHIFRYYRGYYTDKIRDLFPQSYESQAQMAAELAGGTEELAVKAQSALLAGKLQWALELADDVLLLDPTHDGARGTKNAAMLALAEGTINTQARNHLLSDYLLETSQAGAAGAKIQAMYNNPKLAFASIDDNVVPLMPMNTVFRIMAVSLNASKSVEENTIVGLHLTNIQESNSTDAPDYSLHVRRGILDVTAETPANAAFTITSNSPAWKNLALGKLSPQDAVSAGKVVIAGADPQDFYDFMGLFE